MWLALREQCGKLAWLGVPVGLVFGINQLPIYHDIKDPLRARNKHCGKSGGLLYLRYRTGSIGEVISHGAVFDGDRHTYN
jgi:hypothetical protein